VRTALSIQARIGNHKPLHRAIAQNVALYNLFNVSGSHAAIPYCIRINHHRWPVLALVQAPGLVGPYGTFDSPLRELDFKHPLQIRLTVRVATAARIARRALVRTNKYVLPEFWHRLLRL
jgi:hypothetical protein